jgi:hypothetical protein
MAKLKDEIPPPPPSADEVPLPGQPPAADVGGSGITLAPIPDAPSPAPAPDTSLEAALLHELDEAAQETYVVYSDKLFEHGELQATPWPGLSEAVKSAWRAVVKFVRSQEEIHNAGR